MKDGGVHDIVLPGHDLWPNEMSSRHNINHHRVRWNVWSPLMVARSIFFAHTKTLPCHLNPTLHTGDRHFSLMLLSGSIFHQTLFYLSILQLTSHSPSISAIKLKICIKTTITLQMIQRLMAKREDFESSIWILFILTKAIYFHFKTTRVFFTSFSGTVCHSHWSWHAKAVERATLIRQKRKRNLKYRRK
jgi:hypothetical protein